MRLIDFLKDGGNINPSENWEKLPLNGRINYIKNFLYQKGYNPNQTAAIIGNLLQENSTLNPNTKNSIGATGIAQWLGDRKKKLMSNSNPYSIDTQLNHLDNELKGDGWAGYKNLKNSFFKGNNVEELTYTIRKGFERPGEHEAMDSKRIKNAYMVLGQSVPEGYINNYSQQNTSQNYQPSYQYSIPQGAYQGLGWESIKKEKEKNPQMFDNSNQDLEKYFEETMKLEQEKLQQDQIKSQLEQQNKQIEAELLYKQEQRKQILSMVPQSQSVASGNINPKF